MVTLAFDIGISNMALCVAQDNRVRFCDVFSIGSPKDPLNILISNLVKELRLREHSIGHVDAVLIEQQLGRAATKNFALSAVLYSYFRDHFEETTIVKFVNPRQKFKKLSEMKDVPGIFEREEEFKNTRGPKLKKLAVDASIALATHYKDENYLQKLQTLKKKDDLADSALMSLVCS
jgi:hypothetical protein